MRTQTVASPLMVLAILSLTAPRSGASMMPTLVAQEIQVNEPRPLAAAVLRLESQINTPITYEDPPWVFAGDIVVSEQGPLIPRPGTIAFKYAFQADPAPIIRALLNANGAQANPGTFEVLKSENFHHVVPTMYTNAQGKPVAVSPMFGSRVNITARDVTGLQVIELLAEQLSASLKAAKETFVMGTVPASALSRPYETFTCSGSARECLRQLIVKSGYNLSWQIFYDPKLKWYVLNVHPVGYSG